MGRLANIFRVLYLIEQLANKVGEDMLAGGNSGMFALGLAKKLQDEGISVKLELTFKNHDDIQEVSDLARIDTEIYHVGIEYDNKLYDATGETRLSKILELTDSLYGDFNPGGFSDVDPDDSDVQLIIRNKTQWTEDAAWFYSQLQQIR